MAGNSRHKYLAFFSTDGGKRPPRAAAPSDIISIVRSDPRTDAKHFVERLRAKWPHVCLGVFAPWQIHWFFDQHDFYQQGGRFLYDEVLGLMQKQNEDTLVPFCKEWSEYNKTNFHKVSELPVDQLFHEADHRRYGPGFLQKAKEWMMAALDRAWLIEKNNNEARIEQTTLRAPPKNGRGHHNFRPDQTLKRNIQHSVPIPQFVNVGSFIPRQDSSSLQSPQTFVPGQAEVFQTNIGQFGNVLPPHITNTPGHCMIVPSAGQGPLPFPGLPLLQPLSADVPNQIGGFAANGMPLADHAQVVAGINPGGPAFVPQSHPNQQISPTTWQSKQTKSTTLSANSPNDDFKKLNRSRRGSAGGKGRGRGSFSGPRRSSAGQDTRTEDSPWAKSPSKPRGNRSRQGSGRRNTLERHTSTPSEMPTPFEGQETYFGQQAELNNGKDGASEFRGEPIIEPSVTGKQPALQGNFIEPVALTALDENVEPVELLISRRVSREFVGHDIDNITSVFVKFADNASEQEICDLLRPMATVRQVRVLQRINYKLVFVDLASTDEVRKVIEWGRNRNHVKPEVPRQHWNWYPCACTSPVESKKPTCASRQSNGTLPRRLSQKNDQYTEAALIPSILSNNEFSPQDVRSSIPPVRTSGPPKPKQKTWAEVAPSNKDAACSASTPPSDVKRATPVITNTAKDTSPSEPRGVESGANVSTIGSKSGTASLSDKKSVDMPGVPDKPALTCHDLAVLDTKLEDMGPGPTAVAEPGVIATENINRGHVQETTIVRDLHYSQKIYQLAQATNPSRTIISGFGLPMKLLHIDRPIAYDAPPTTQEAAGSGNPSIEQSQVQPAQTMPELDCASKVQAPEPPHLVTRLAAPLHDNAVIQQGADESISRTPTLTKGARRSSAALSVSSQELRPWEDEYDELTGLVASVKGVHTIRKKQWVKEASNHKQALEEAERTVHEADAKLAETATSGKSAKPKWRKRRKVAVDAHRQHYDELILLLNVVRNVPQKPDERLSQKYNLKGHDLPQREIFQPPNRQMTLVKQPEIIDSSPGALRKPMEELLRPFTGVGSSNVLSDILAQRPLDETSIIFTNTGGRGSTSGSGKRNGKELAGDGDAQQGEDDDAGQIAALIASQTQNVNQTQILVVDTKHGNDTGNEPGEQSGSDRVVELEEDDTRIYAQDQPPSASLTASSKQNIAYEHEEVKEQNLCKPKDSTTASETDSSSTLKSGETGEIVQDPNAEAVGLGISGTGFDGAEAENKSKMPKQNGQSGSDALTKTSRCNENENDQGASSGTGVTECQGIKVAAPENERPAPPRSKRDVLIALPKTSSVSWAKVAAGSSKSQSPTSPSFAPPALPGTKTASSPSGPVSSPPPMRTGDARNRSVDLTPEMARSRSRSGRRAGKSDEWSVQPGEEWEKRGFPGRRRK